MSLCVVLESKDYLYFGADTAASTSYKGTTYRVTDYIEKVFPIDNNKLLFFGGDANLGYEILEEFQKLSNHNIRSLVEVSKKIYSAYKDSEKSVIRLVFSQFRGGKPITYQLLSKENFEVHKTVVNDDTIRVIAQGYRMEECTDIIEEIARPNMRAEDIYQAVFDRVSCEAVGGSVIVYFLDKVGHILCYKNKVKDKKNLLRYNLPYPIKINKQLSEGWRNEF